MPSEPSDALPVTASSNVAAQAACGAAGKVVSCGYQMTASAAQLSNVVVVVIAVAPNPDRTACIAHLACTTPGLRARSATAARGQ